MKNILLAPFRAEIESEIKNAFALGKKAGYEEGIRDGMERNFERSRGLSEEEYKEVIDFLVSRGIELCCYDVHRYGFEIRKRLDHLDHLSKK